MGVTLQTPVGSLSGVGPARKAALEARGIRTAEDLLLFFPRDHRSSRTYPLSAETCGVYAGYELTVDTAPTLALLPGRRRLLKFRASDEANTSVTIYYFNQPYLRNQIFKGDRFVFFGELHEKAGAFSLFSPERLNKAPPPDEWRPVYPALPSFSQKTIEKLIRAVLPEAKDLADPLPEMVLSRFSLPSRAETVRSLHAPKNGDELSRARRRLTFERYFSFGLELNRFRTHEKALAADALRQVDLTPFFARFPYSFTGAQRRAVASIEKDLTGTGRIPLMNRLLQGDVGSGKTAVAAAAAYLACENGGGVLFMAPTEILARQHFENLLRIFDPLGIPVLLLTGSVTKKERESVYAVTDRGGPYLLVGTHALIEETARCRGVILAVTDEQHRFGVRQRAALREKGAFCHSLAMSATPIPRSLALFLYAPEEISVLDEMPPGRQKVDTYYVGEDKKQRLFSFLRERLAEGERAFVVCPLIEPNDALAGLTSAEDAYREFSRELAGFGVGFLHGKMKNAEKIAVMRSFQTGETQLLVSTTVVEVGVDVPEATVMIVLNADRFGLSQLHQLRGRVGRGPKKSVCILVSVSSARSARERLKFLCEENDGFAIAQYDLKTRGPGEFFGERQTGFSALDPEELSLDFARDAIQAAKEFPDLLPQKTLQY